MFTRLETPDTGDYTGLKELILGPHFGWSHNAKATPYMENSRSYQDLSFYSHAFLHGPSPRHGLYSKANSEYLPNVETVIGQIFELNNVKMNVVYRINANAVHPVEGNVLTVPHTDHEFPHKNMLIYLTNTGGDTIVFDDAGKKHHFTPVEDDIVTFEGLHCMVPPKQGRRVVIVVTYL
tara:strand:+ start:812 stop:1348 length:537 start_codon:yes stop_codon:yes gene_type:complete